MYFYIVSVVLLLLSIFVYKYVTYHMVIRKPMILIVVMLIVVLAPSTYKVVSSSRAGVTSALNAREFRSNQDSEYSQLWLDYLSFRDSEIGRLGSEEKFREFLSIKNYTERSFAIEVVTGILEDQGVSDVYIAEKCVQENITGSLE